MIDQGVPVEDDIIAPDHRTQTRPCAAVGIAAMRETRRPLPESWAEKGARPHKTAPSATLCTTKYRLNS